MEVAFPKDALIVLLQFARTQQFNMEVIKAAYEVLKYVWYLAEQKLLPKVVGAEHEELNPEQMIKAILADHVINHKHRPELTGSGLQDVLTKEDADHIESHLGSDVAQFGPGLWIGLSLWLLQVVLKKIID